MDDWKAFKNQLLQNHEVKAEYDKLKPKYDLIKQLIQLRQGQGLTQVDVAKKLGTKQSAIARFESGKTNPTLSFLTKLTSSLGHQLHISVK